MPAHSYWAFLNALQVAWIWNLSNDVLKNVHLHQNLVFLVCFAITVFSPYVTGLISTINWTSLCIRLINQVLLFTILETQLYRSCIPGLYSIMLNFSVIDISHHQVGYWFTDRVKAGLFLQVAKVKLLQINYNNYYSKKKSY